MEHAVGFENIMWVENEGEKKKTKEENPKLVLLLGGCVEGQKKMCLMCARRDEAEA